MADGTWMMADGEPTFHPPYAISPQPSAMTRRPVRRGVHFGASYDPTSSSSCAVPAVRRQRLRRADLRNRLVPAPAARHRLVVDLAGHPARDLHGRPVPGQPASAAASLGPA